jgi:hypothetical protein
LSKKNLFYLNCLILFWLREEKMLKKYQVLLYDWLEEHVKYLADKYDSGPYRKIDLYAGKEMIPLDYC